jgi:HlyD family secretion protein
MSGAGSFSETNYFPTRQIRDEAIGEQSSLDAKREHLVFSEDELASSMQSLDRGIITRTIVSTLQKDVIAAKGEIGRLTAKVAELKGKISEQQLKVLTIPLDMKEKSADKLNQLGQQSQKLMENRNSIIYKLTKLEVQAPVGEIV